MYGDQVQTAIVSGHAEAIARIRQGYKGGLGLVDGGCGVQLVKKAVGAGDVEQRAVGRDIGGDGSGVIEQSNPGYGAGAERVNQHSEIAGDDEGRTIVR